MPTTARTHFRRTCSWGCLAALAVALDVRAAHPLISEDAFTQGAGRSELELGTATTREGSSRTFELDPQFSYGALQTLDVIVRPSWVALSGDAIGASGRRTGFGDTA